MADSSLPALSAWSLLTRWSLRPSVVIPWSVGVVAYVRAVRRLRAAGGTWSRARVVAFAAGAGTLLVALASGIDGYADVFFSVHAVQHLLLTMVAPPLLACSAPVTLALRTLPRERARTLVRALHARPIRWLTHPVVGWLLFASAPFAVHFSGAYDDALTNAWVHAGEHLLLFTVGLLYWWPIVGIDPMPRPLPHPARLLSLVLAMPAQSFLALAISSAPLSLYPGYVVAMRAFGASPISDQRTAAALMWVGGGLLLVTAVLVSVLRWKRDDERRERRREAGDGDLRLVV